MKKYILFISTLLLCAQAGAQVELYFKPSSSIHLSAKECLNAQVNNLYAYPLQVRLLATVSNENDLLVQMQSQAFELRAGFNEINPLQVGIERISYYDYVLQSYEEQSGFLPPGNYTICLQLECAYKNCMEWDGSSGFRPICEPRRVENVSPLLLSFPEDKKVLDNDRPQFGWIPPMPVGSSPEIRYTIVFTELRPGQSAEEAIRQNAPLYTNPMHQGNTLAFPSEIEALEKGKRYAWMVRAFLGDHFAAQSEAWMFELLDSTCLHFYDVEMITQKNKVPQYSSMISLEKDYLAIKTSTGNYYDKIARDYYWGVYDYKDSNNYFAIQKNDLKIMGKNKYLVDLRSIPLIPQKTYAFFIADIRNDQKIIRIDFYRNQ